MLSIVQDDDFDSKPKISSTPGGGKGGGKGGGGRDHNMDVCARCEDSGVTMMCDGPCQRSFHPACLGMDDNPEEDPWMCTRCSSKVQKVGVCACAYACVYVCVCFEKKLRTVYFEVCM